MAVFLAKSATTYPFFTAQNSSSKHLDRLPGICLQGNRSLPHVPWCPSSRPLPDVYVASLCPSLFFLSLRQRRITLSACLTPHVRRTVNYATHLMRRTVTRTSSTPPSPPAISSGVPPARTVMMGHGLVNECRELIAEGVRSRSQ